MPVFFFRHLTLSNPNLSSIGRVFEFFPGSLQRPGFDFFLAPYHPRPGFEFFPVTGQSMASPTSLFTFFPFTGMTEALGTRKMAGLGFRFWEVDFFFLFSLGADSSLMVVRERPARRHGWSTREAQAQ